jgi:hypothetical protein
MPSKRRSTEPSRVVDEKQDELEGVREAYEVELGCRRERDRGVTGVECPGEDAP